MFKKMIFALFLSLFAVSGFCYTKADHLPSDLAFGDCGDYHVKHASWTTKAKFKGSTHQLDLIGRCTGGQKHGQFQLFFDNLFIGKAKIVRENSVSAKCYDGKNNLIAEAKNLNGCIDAYVDMILK